MCLREGGKDTWQQLKLLAKHDHHGNLHLVLCPPYLLHYIQPFFHGFEEKNLMMDLELNKILND